MCTNHFLLAIPLFGNAKTTCLDKVAVLELKRDYAISSSGVWGYFDWKRIIKKSDYINSAVFVPEGKSLSV